MVSSSEKMLHSESPLTFEYQRRLYLSFSDANSGNDSLNLSVVIPAYNEEKRIRKILSDLETIDEVKEVIVVIDGNDRTHEIAAKFRKAKTIKSEMRLGKGGAIIEGIKQTKGDVIAYVDADGAISGTEVLRLAKLVHGERQLIIGSRWLKESKVNKHQPLVRKLLSRGFNVLTFAVLGLKLRDTQCGLKAFPISVKQEVIPHIGTKNLFFDVSFIFNCKIRNYDIHEVGIEWSDVEDSKLRIFTTVIVFLVYLFGLRLANSKYSSLFAPYYTKFRWLYEPSHNK